MIALVILHFMAQNLLVYLLCTYTTVIVNFGQSSYEVMEDNGLVNAMILLSQSSSVPFQLVIHTIDATAESTNAIKLS